MNRRWKLELSKEYENPKLGVLFQCEYENVKASECVENTKASNFDV